MKTNLTILAGAIRAEWIKLRSVRATYLTMFTAVALGIGLGAADTASIARHWATMNAADRAAFDPVGDSFTGFVYGELAFGVLGVLAISSEYTTGMIRATLTAVPHRGTVLAAKALALGAVTLVLGELFTFTTFLLGQAILSGKHLEVSLTDPDVLRAVASAGLYLAVVAIVGLGLGTVIRHTPAAIAALFALVYLAYGAARALEPWTYLPSQLLLTNASDVLAQLHPRAAKPRLPSLDLAYLDLALYLLVTLTLGAWRVTRDA
ncbi:MAG: ABC transporter permease subunit [Frankia sp.]